MRVLHQILITFVMIAGMSLAVSAQKEDKKPRPPKPPPPVINPREDKKPPKNEDKPKKPGMAMIVGKIETVEAE